MKSEILYKKTSTGAIEQWQIRVDKVDYGYAILTTHGQVGGKLQEACDVIREGKNVGKKNETTALQQATKEAEAKFEKQLKKGYVKTIEEAEAGKVDAIIEGGVAPMLAHKFNEQGHKITYPAFVQPKLDGHRCIAIVKDGKATLWTRTRKPITGVPHIQEILERTFPEENIILDGELYNHDLKNDFEQITSHVRQETPQPGHEIVEYHVYDVVNDKDAWTRQSQLDQTWLLHTNKIQYVQTVEIDNEDELMEAFDDFIKQGYEGAMVRNAKGLYVNKRSADLQKVKEFDDDEYEVIGVEAGRGKMADKAIFVCKTVTGTEFRAKMKGNLDELKKYLDNPGLALGKLLTVQYQGLTGASKVPRFPVGLRLREDV